jgi:DNA polymerase III subunit beta
MTSTKMIPQFDVNCAAFARELDFVASAAETKTTMPILATVKLDVRDGALHLTKTSLDTTAQSRIDLEGDLILPEGAICVDLKRLLTLIKGLSAAEAILTIEPDNLLVKSGRSKFSLSGWKASDFPDVEKIEGQTVELPALAIAGLLSATCYSVSTEEDNRVLIHALEFRVGASGLTMTGTNGKMSARAEVETTLSGDFKVALSRFLFRALSAMTAGGEEKLTCTLGERAVKFQSGPIDNPGHRSLSGRLLAGSPLPFDSIFDPKPVKICTFSKTEASRALNRLMIVSDAAEQGSKPINLELSDGFIEINAETKDIGEGKDGFSAENVIPRYGARYNGWQLLQALNACQAETVHMGESNKACRFDAWWLLNEHLKLKYTTLSAPLRLSKGEEVKE